MISFKISVKADLILDLIDDHFITEYKYAISEPMFFAFIIALVPSSITLSKPNERTYS